MTVWLRRRGAGRPDAEVRLVCLAHAGGSASFFGAWADLFGSSVEVVAVQYPGHEDRISERCATSVAELVDGIAGALVGPDDRPVALFGHSMGTVVAYELARRLQWAGRPVRHLFVSGRTAPDEAVTSSVHRGSDADLVAELERLGGTSAAVLADPELRELLLPPIRADYRIAETYRPRPGPQLTCPVTAMIADADPEVTPEQGKRWEAHTTGPFELLEFPGDHFYLVPHRLAVAQALSTRLTPH